MTLFISFVSVFILLIFSALISASEVAFFSLSLHDKEELKHSQAMRDKTASSILANPKLLLATILIANNLVNIGIVLIASFAMAKYISLFASPLLAFLLQVVLITFFILLFGEVIPKVYARRHPLGMSRMMAIPMSLLEKALYPLSIVLMASTTFIERRVRKKQQKISVEDLSHALEITASHETPEHERKILKGIVKFGTVNVKQIMVPRTDITAAEYNTLFTKLLEEITASGFSRIPVYKGTIDKIIGILHIKDLLAHSHKGDDFKWQPLVRETLFVPENKKSDDLLKEFQTRKSHLAVVVDEFGGTSGIVTLEDVMEEIVGEINDEFDDDDLVYSRLDERNYVFEGKVSLYDLSRKTGIDSREFELPGKGETSTLAGFLIEYTGAIPRKNEEIKFRSKRKTPSGGKQYIFTVESADNRKIKRVKVTLPE